MGLIWGDELTWPPSGQKMSLGTRTGRRYPNPLYSNWLHANMPRILSVPLEAPIDEPVLLKARFRAPTLRKYDLDNHIKPCQDLLQRAGVIVDDALIHEVHMKKLPVVKGEGGFVVVELYTL